MRMKRTLEAGQLVSSDLLGLLVGAFVGLVLGLKVGDMVGLLLGLYHIVMR